VKPGELVVLDASPSSDPDGNQLTYKWWIHDEVSNTKSEISIKNGDQAKASLTIPEAAKAGSMIHVICEVTDNGNPSLTRYARVILSL